MSEPLYTFTCEGIPAPKGSKTLSRGQMRESSVKLPAWNKALDDAIQWDKEPLDGPLQVDHMFYFARPKKHYRANGELRDDAPDEYTIMPDYDKLERAVNDALTRNGVIKDDARISDGAAKKRYGGAAGVPASGCVTTIRRPALSGT